MTLVTPTIQRWLDDGRRDPDGLWARAADELPWFRKWDRVFAWDPPTFRWFIGAETNLGFNAVDRHVLAGDAGRAALVYINERGDAAPPRFDLGDMTTIEDEGSVDETRLAWTQMKAELDRRHV
jgi:hypothetical protein